MGGMKFQIPLTVLNNWPEKQNASRLRGAGEQNHLDGFSFSTGIHCTTPSIHVQVPSDKRRSCLFYYHFLFEIKSKTTFGLEFRAGFKLSLPVQSSSTIQKSVELQRKEKTQEI